MRKIILSFLVITMLITATTKAQIITTVAGNGTQGYSGNGGVATAAAIFSPEGVAVDSLGNIYILDIHNNCIRKVDPTGTINTVAGNGTSGFSGDGGSATLAQFNNPFNVGVDANGNYYIADYFNQRIRKVNKAGIISTVAGSGVNGFSGDGGLALNANFAGPFAVAFDGIGNMFITDSYNNRIRRVDAQGIITTVAGTGATGTISGGYNGDNIAATSATLNGPQSIAADAVGNLFIADFFNQRVRKVDLNGIITTVAGNGIGRYNGDGGLATLAELNYPQSVAVDAAGNLYVSDMGNSRIRKVDPNGIITTVAGNGFAGYSGDGGLATQAQIWNAYSIAVDAKGNLYIADTDNKRIRKVTFTTLPLNLIDFYVREEVNGNVLVWNTADEINTANFLIERSTDGSTFFDIATIPANGKDRNKYSYTDIVNASGSFNYRLKCIDKNGSYIYSQIVNVSKDIARYQLKISPNPTNNILNVQVNASKAEIVTIQLIDLQGKVISTEKKQFKNGNNTFLIPVAAFAKGSYILVVRGSKTEQAKFIKY